jgi:hypothetical protein
LRDFAVLNVFDMVEIGAPDAISAIDECVLEMVVVRIFIVVLIAQYGFGRIGNAAYCGESVAVVMKIQPSVMVPQTRYRKPNRIAG